MTSYKIIFAVENDKMIKHFCRRATRLSELVGSKNKLVQVIELMSPLIASGAGVIVTVAVVSGEHSGVLSDRAN